MITQREFPAVFIGRNVSSGEDDVRDHFEEYILAEKQRIATGTPENPVNLTPVNPGSLPETPALSLYVIVVAALVDSINPCAFAVLIILLAYLTSLGERRRIAIVGCTYIATVFVVYFIAGLGLLTVVQGIGLTGIVFTVAAVIAIIAGLINIAEVLLRREIFTLAIPVSQKDAIDRYIKKASVPSAIVLGALVSMVELPCTGGIYLAILGLIGDKMTLARGDPVPAALQPDLRASPRRDPSCHVLGRYTGADGSIPDRKPALGAASHGACHGCAWGSDASRNNIGS